MSEAYVPASMAKQLVITLVYFAKYQYSISTFFNTYEHILEYIGTAYYAQIQLLMNVYKVR